MLAAFAMPTSRCGGTGMPIPLNGLLSSAMSFLPVMTNQTGFEENNVMRNRCRSAPVSPSSGCQVKSRFWTKILRNFSETTCCNSFLHSAFSTAPSFSDFVFAEIDSLVECSLSADAETLSVDPFQLIYELQPSACRLDNHPVGQSSVGQSIGRHALPTRGF